MENEELYKELVSIDEIQYYYHVTNIDGDDILEKGLYMVDKDIAKTMISLSKEYKKDPLSSAMEERGERGTYRNNANVIILGIMNEDLPKFVNKVVDIPHNWTIDTAPEYCVSSKYIAGYINTSTEEFIFNEEFEYNYLLYSSNEKGYKR